jgi:hypothetical protein
MPFKKSTKQSIDVVVPFIGLSLAGWHFIGKAKDRDIKYIIFVMVLLGIALYGITSSVTKYFLEKAIEKLPSVVKAEIITENGVSSEEFEAANTASVSIYDAFHSSWDEDEEKAISAVKSMGSAQMVKTLSAIYQKKFGKSLKADFEEYVKDVLGIDWRAIPDYVKESWY